MFRPLLRSRLSRRLKSVATLVTIGLLSVPLVGWSSAVEVRVDGDLLTTRTYAATVGDVLAQLDVPVGPADEVTPAPDAPVEDGVSIDVARAISVDVYIDGVRNRRVVAPVSSVAGILTAADLDVRGTG